MNEALLFMKGERENRRIDKAVLVYFLNVQTENETNFVNIIFLFLSRISEVVLSLAFIASMHENNAMN